MTLWFVFALMTVAAIFAVLWPLSRRAPVRAGGSEANVYKDQLAEIDRDVAAGLIGPSEADAARIEIGRRLLTAVDHRARCRRRSRISACAARPRFWRWSGCRSWRPRSTLRLARRSSAISRWRARNTVASANQPLDNLVAQVEAHLEKNPTDGRGWSVLAPVLVRLGRYDDAVRAYRNSITYNGDSAERHADLGEALSGAAGGVVTAEAKTEFERAVALNADELKAQLLPWPCRRAGRPQRRCRIDLASDAGESAGGCAMAAAGSGRAGAGRRRNRAGAVG